MMGASVITTLPRELWQDFESFVGEPQAGTGWSSAYLLSVCWSIAWWLWWTSDSGHPGVSGTYPWLGGALAARLSWAAATPPDPLEAHIYLLQYVRRVPGTSLVGEIRLPLGHKLLFSDNWWRPSIACNEVEILRRRQRVTDWRKKTEIICCQTDLTCNVFIPVSYLWSLNEMFNNLQWKHLLPENCRVEFKVLSSQAFCLGDGEGGLAYRFLPAAFLWFSAAFFLCYKWIVAVCQQVQCTSARKENAYPRHIHYTYIWAHGGLLGVSHFLKTPLLSVNAPFIFPSSSCKCQHMSGSVLFLNNSSEKLSHRKPPLSIPYRTSFVQLGGWHLPQLSHQIPILLRTPSQFIHSANITEGFLCARQKAVFWGYQGELNGPTLALNEIRDL